MPSAPRLRFAVLLLLLSSWLAGPGRAAESGTAAPVAADKIAAGPALVLPTVEVRAQRIKQLDKEIKRLDKLITREKKKVKSTELDRTLNNAQVSRVAAIFGGNSADHLSAVAATRVALLENERSVMEAMKRPATLDELAMMQTEIDQLRLARRNLDDASKQR